MSKTVIKFGLSARDIDRAIKEITAYKQEFEQKVTLYRQRIASELAAIAELNFANSTVDDIVKGSPRKPDVKVSVSEHGNISVIVASGEDGVWCEFGSGVYHNGSAGSSPHPNGAGLGFTIGSYGKGHGKQQAWGYYDDKGELVITRGTPATMPMYHATQDVLRKAVQIAREVFG